ncbi:MULTISPECIES: hypothetical protein [Nonomuraea]|uniref:Uncharacterized protein n=1 Tax=Nonomuraea mangrovi TaxID=2316207 RepID=A0ABW4SL95_9ACTN
MNPTRRTWVSAAAVGVIVVGGVYVAAAASAGRLEKVSQETRAVVNTPAPSDQPAETNTTTDDDTVVSHEVNQDPQAAVDYWTDARMEGAEPMPMPEATGKLNDVDD